MSVYIEHRENSTYPSYHYGFAPSQKYPEYRWNDVACEKNDVYDMVRECLRGYGGDQKNYGKPQWNPLGEIVSPGDTVVIKPNWVEDKNENKNGGMDCLVTNASVIRAVIDYVDIALGGTGRIIVGDSPMPDCNLENLMNVAHYNEIWKSCCQRGIQLEVADFREDVVTGFANEVKETTGDNEVVVDIGADSFFSDSEYNIGKYRNGIVDATKMNEYYHQPGHHRYGINRLVLNADVIINLCKPKSHRKAGFTASLKNYIGICARKISIPHNVMGNEKEGGDTYFGPKIIFETEQKIRDQQNKAQSNGRHLLGFFLKVSRIPFWGFRRITHKKYFGTGNWYKNDTIWRSILDLNRIMIYADKDGKLCDTPQRKFFTLGDMIISGHKNGPLAPTPIKIETLLCAENPVAFDETVIRIMGFNRDYLPVLHRVGEEKRYLLLQENIASVMVHSNDERIDGKNIEDIPKGIYGQFCPAEGWDVLAQ